MRKYPFRTGRTISFQLIALFLCALIPLQVFGVVLFSSGYSTISEQINSLSVSTMLSISENVKKELDVLLYDLYEISDNTTLRQLTYPLNKLDLADYYSSLKESRDYIETIVNNNSWIEDIRIYITHTATYLSVFNSFSEVVWGKYRHSAYEQADFDALLQSAREVGTNRLIWDENGPYIAILYPESSYVSSRESQPYFIVQIRLDESQLRSALSAKSFGDQESTAMLDRSCGKIIAGDGASLDVSVFSALYEAIQGEPFPFTGDFSYGGVDYFATACAEEKLGLVFLRLTPRSSAMRSLQHYRLGLFGFVVISLMVFVLCALLSLHAIRTPVLQLIGGFEEIERGNYRVSLPTAQKADEFAYLSGGFNRMVAKLNATIDHLYKQEIYTQRMELNQLQMQINPHFLFNSYFMMERLLQQGEYDVVAELSNCLGEYFRYISRDARRYVELELEWSHMYSYAKVQQLRYQHRLELIIDPVPEDYRSYIVPRLILQPLVENAVEHGLAHMKTGGMARLGFVCDEEYLRIIVEDNGSDVSDALISDLKKRLNDRETAGHETSALMNIHRRLQLYYGAQYGLDLSRSRLNGLRLEIRLPSKERKEGKDSNANAERADRG